jgi:hypothetical protein
MSQSAPKSAVTPKANGQATPAVGRVAPQPARKTTPAKKTAPTKTSKTSSPKPATTKTTARKPADKPAATKAVAAKPPAKKTPAKKTPAKKAPAKKTAASSTTPASKTPAPKAPAAKKAAARERPVTPPAPAPVIPREAAPVVEVEPPAPAVAEEARRSWFTRRPLTFSRPEWADNWFEQGRPLTRLRTAIVVGPLMVGLVVAGAFGARMMYADPAPVSAPGPDVTCWDRTVAPAVRCTLPTGVTGLEWVYPTFDHQDAACVDVLRAHPEYRRPTMWTCAGDIHGRPLQITYSELTSVGTGLAYHEKLFADGKRSAFPGPRGTVDHYVWRLPDPVDGKYRMAAMYVDYPYAVLIEASTLRDRDRAYRDLVKQRDPRHISTRFS